MTLHSTLHLSCATINVTHITHINAVHCLLLHTYINLYSCTHKTVHSVHAFVQEGGQGARLSNKTKQGIRWLVCRQIGGSSAQQLTITISRMCTITICRVRVNHTFELLSFWALPKDQNLFICLQLLILSFWLLGLAPSSLGLQELSFPGTDLSITHECWSPGQPWPHIEAL